MPGSRRREHRLERVLGTPALFSTAYGNVGSSIYYALGVTARLALGLTPLVFVIAGLVLRRDRRSRTPREPCATRRRAARRASRATPSTSSCASGPPGRRCSTTSSRSPSRRSSCPHYLVGLLGAAAREPVGHRRRRDRHRRARGAERRRHPGVGEAEHRPRRHRLRDAAAARAPRLRARLQPSTLSRERPLGRRADVEQPRCSRSRWR